MLHLILKTLAPSVRDRKGPTGTPLSVPWRATGCAAGDPAPKVYPGSGELTVTMAVVSCRHRVFRPGTAAESQPRRTCLYVTQSPMNSQLWLLLCHNCDAEKPAKATVLTTGLYGGSVMTSWLDQSLRLAGETTGRLVRTVMERLLLFYLFEAGMRSSLWGQDVPSKGKQPIIGATQQKGTVLALVAFISPSCCSNNSGRG